MATYTKINSWVEKLAEAGVNLSSDQLVVALTNTAHTATWDELADLTQVSYTYCSSRNITTSSSSQTSGTYKLVIDDLTLTASGGAIGPFRYVYIYDDTVSGDPLICYYDYGSSITLNDGEEINLDFDGTNGLFQLA